MSVAARHALPFLLAALGNAQEPVRYDREIRPLLSDRCFRCHGPDPSTREAKLRLDLREEATKEREGTIAIVPGRLDASELWSRVTSEDPEERMPPAKANKHPFSKDELALVKRWIEEGARYEPHWAFVPPKRPALPELRRASWVRNEIDRFIAKRLEESGLQPNPEADRATLARRVFLDVTGLPPTPAEVDAFVADQRPNAYEALVDRLLHEEPYQTRYAERMATPWLDAARYADTIGIHTDAGRSIWPYRDWVIESFRSGMPFDRFLTEQLAGDLLPEATTVQKIASGFHRCQVQTDEGGAIPAEYIVEYGVERVATTGAAFLGLTLGCARCHDHKFDPFTQQDFYSLFGFFNSIEEPGLFSQLPDSKRAFEPFLLVPTPAQETKLASSKTEITRLREALSKPSPEDDDKRAKWRENLVQQIGLRWDEAKPVAAKAKGAQLSIETDGSVFASGPNPERDDHEIRLSTTSQSLRLVVIEALTDKRLPRGRVGRASNGNAVLSEVSAVVISKDDPSKRQEVHFSWAWADHEQDNEDWVALNAIDGKLDTGWAVDGHRKAGGRMLLLLAEGPFGFAGGSEVVMTLHYQSEHAQHVLGRVRVSLASVNDAVLNVLPIANGAWHVVGPFPPAQGQIPYASAFGPESDSSLDRTKNFGAGNQYWRFAANVRDGVVASLPDGVHVTYLGRRIVVPSSRKATLSLGSDDAILFYVDGKEVLGKNVERGVAPDQERVTVELREGKHVLVAKVVNTGGQGGFYFKRLPQSGELHDDLALALAPASATGEFGKRFDQAWRIAESPDYAAASAKLAILDRERLALEAEIPRTMVMKELEKPRPNFLLTRGQYDKPDKTKPAPRALPAWLGTLPEGAPRDRLALAKAMTGPENPLVARVAVNRLWELFFGTGIVRTVEDLGHQGEWPSHEQLLDWLAVEYRASRWDTKAMVKKLITSATYRQSSRAREEAREKDPENRLLSWYPRRRLAAEQIRDLALHVSGLLVEKVGGPSVKPYQPPGLWEEIAMPASNTRNFVPGKGEDHWRRSLYTYWKRASPPPALLTFDAPTRESCTPRRPSTSTPLQALVLWNDVQFVEAARALAQITLREKPASDGDALRSMHRKVTSQEPNARALRELSSLLERFRARFAAAPADAAALLATGEAPLAKEFPPAELAAFTMVANALLNLDATICKD